MPPALLRVARFYNERMFEFCFVLLKLSRASTKALPLKFPWQLSGCCSVLKLYSLIVGRRNFETLLSFFGDHLNKL